jgi:hypothetical protein
MGTGPLPMQVEYGPLALLVKVPWIVRVALDIAGLAHGATGFAVQVSMTLPAVLSAPLGVYVVLGEEALANIPVPLEVHMPEPEFIELAEMPTGPAPAHVLYGPPALLVGAACTMSTAAFDVTMPHPPVMTTSYEPASAPKLRPNASCIVCSERICSLPTRSGRLKS